MLGVLGSVSVEARDISAFLSHFLSYPLRQGFSLHLELVALYSDEPASSRKLPLTTLVLGAWVLGVKLGSWCLHGKHLY